MTTASRPLKDGPAATKGKKENKKCAAKIILALCHRFTGLEINSFLVSWDIMRNARLYRNTHTHTHTLF